MVKKKKIIVKLSNKKQTNYYYTTVLDKRSDTRSLLKVRKYDPFTRKHLTFVETKLK